MNWGELSQRPFIAEVWGTVAEWAGAIGTVAAAFIALYVFARDRRISSRIQAQQIVLRHDAAGSDVLIRNVSAQPVFKAALRWRIARLKVPGHAEPDARKKIKAGLRANAAEWDIIEAGHEKRSLHIHSQPVAIDIFLIPRLTLQDVRGQFWRVEPLGVGNGKPTKIRQYRALRKLATYPGVYVILAVGSAVWKMVLYRLRSLRLRR